MVAGSPAWAVVPVPCAADGLVEGIAERLRAPIIRYERFEFANKNVLIEVDPAALSNRVDHVLLVAEGCGACDGHIIELGLVADALRRLRPTTIHCLLRYLPYSRSNRAARPGMPLGAKVYIDMLCALPIDTFITFNLHAPELVGFFSTPVYCLDSLPGAAEELVSLARRYDLVIGTDRGRLDECVLLADRFQCDLDFFTKRRVGHDGTVVTQTEEKTRAAGRRVLLFDDEIDSGHSAYNAAQLLSEAGAASIDFFTIYDFARPGAFERLAEVPKLAGVYRTNASVRSPLHALPVPSHTFDLAPLLHALYASPANEEHQDAATPS